MVAAAGTHLLSRRERVATIGNVYTRRDCRGRGLGRIVMSAVREALAGIDTIGLNVRVDNRAAIRVYESLGFVFATGAMTDGIRLENVQLRIGGPRETDIEGLGASDLKRVHRALGAYLSLRDQVQLVVKSIEVEDITDENGVPFQIFYGISDNTHRFWSIQNARDVIGYAPEDDSQTRFANQISGVLAAAKNES